ncbi:glycosyltransferase family 4 protein [candidate division KSB1 bacterium]|nr:glycosyltransferase family 4 protein [candidate division KSB1 bacterium]
MKLVFIRSKIPSTIFGRHENTAPEFDRAALESMKISAKAGSSSKNIIFGLQKYKLVSSCEEWKFWSGAYHEIVAPGQLKVKLFPCDQRQISPSLADYIAAHGQPDILWVEGTEFPPYLRQIFELCPKSFKMVYSKEWRPWNIEHLELYQLCLVDEEKQRKKLALRFPRVHSAVWDKLIDYETSHCPLPLEKVYDICYVAYLRERKNHELLFRAMAKLPERKLTCVCVGDDRRGNREELEQLAAALKLSVHFTGEVLKEEVNYFVNQSRMGVMCSVMDAVPRAILEYMAADVPALVNAYLVAGTRYVGPQAGLVKTPEEFHHGIAEILDNLPRYSPRAHYLKHYSFERVMTKFINILSAAGAPFARK